MLTRLIRIQLALFAAVTVVVVITLGWYYLRLPSLMGVDRYTLYAELPRSGGLYSTANVTYRGAQIGKVTAVTPTRSGVRAAMSIDDRYRIPLDASADVHSVSAIGEQYLDLVSAGGNAGQYFHDGQTITRSTVPAQIGPALDAGNRSLSVLPREKISALLDETGAAFGGLGPSLRHLVDATQALAHDFRSSQGQLDDVIDHSAPLLDSQARSRDPIKRWAANLDAIAGQTAAQDRALRAGLAQAPPTLDALNTVFGGVRDTLPQTLANVEVVVDMLKRYHKNVEQILVGLPQLISEAETATTTHPGKVVVEGRVQINEPPPCLTGFLPASQWRSPADTSTAELPVGTYCKIPLDFQGNDVRGARNFPCVDEPGKRAATAHDCHSAAPYIPAGTNPWYGEPGQLRNCPAPGARCDQAVKPGIVIPAPTIDNGLNPAPADRLPAPPTPRSDPLTRPGQGSVQCSGQQPNPCLYTPASGAPAIYTPQNGIVATPDGTTFTVNDSTHLGDDAWKQMLSPAAVNP
jgi:phospholipid/cholesterol/gamma-HCH transport system substrate-binding protein